MEKHNQEQNIDVGYVARNFTSFFNQSYECMFSYLNLCTDLYIQLIIIHRTFEKIYSK